MKILKKHKYFLSIFLVFVMTFCGGVYSVNAYMSPHTIFSNNKEEILSLTFSGQYEGYVFALGCADLPGDSTDDTEDAISEAEIEAVSNLVPPIPLDVDFPPHLSTQITEQLNLQFQKIHSSPTTVRGMETVYEECNGSNCVVVLAAPLKGYDKVPASWQQLHASLKKEFYQSNPIISPLIYLEICKEEELSEVIIQGAILLSKEYGTNLKDVILGKNIKKPSLLYKQGKRIAYEKIKGLNKEDLFSLLSLSPYDPVIIYALGQVLEEEGYGRLSDLLYTRGTVWRIDERFNALCQRKAQAGLFANQIKSLQSSERRCFELLKQDTNDVSVSISGLAKLVSDSCGTMPLDFRRSDYVITENIEDQGVSKFLEKDLSTQRLAMLARYFVNKSLRHAIPFAIQAGRMDARYLDLASVIFLKHSIDSAGD